MTDFFEPVGEYPDVPRSGVAAVLGAADAAVAELANLREAVTEIRELHHVREDSHECPYCGECGRYPCETVAVLDRRGLTQLSVDYNEDELELRVGQKWMTAAAARTPQLPDLDMASWCDTETLSAQDVPQFPRERWVSYPLRRTVALILVDRMLDLELTDAEWIQVCMVMWYGGKERVA